MDREYNRTAISLERQAASVVKLWPELCYKIENGLLEITGKIQPTELNRTYSFRLEYSLDSVPKVWIVHPKVETQKNGVRLEHFYHDEGQPCPYRPAADWSPRIYLGNTVIPWLAEWLFFYEVWLATGKWMGGGAHPSGRPDDDWERERQRVRQQHAGTLKIR